MRFPSAELARHRWSGEYEVDEWGLDHELVELVSPLAGLRWGIDVVGAERLPAEGPVVIVFNVRFGLSEPFVLGRGVRLATGRWARVSGIPDVAPIGPWLRRFGGVLAVPEERASLLRSGAVVGVPLGREPRHRRRAGCLAPEALAPAVETGAPVVAATVTGRELGRRWRVVLGEPLPPPPHRGPLAAAELGDAARAAVQALLDRL